MNMTFVIPKNDDEENKLQNMAQCRIFPPVGLARMAGIAGQYGSVHLVDERIDSIQHETQANIAVIFINNYNFQRAYSLADYYHQHGSFVVFTGPRLDQTPKEAGKFADCLFIGGGENCMYSFLSDYMSGRTRRLYGGKQIKTAAINFSMKFNGTVLRLA